MADAPVSGNVDAASHPNPVMSLDMVKKLL